MKITVIHGNLRHGCTWHVTDALLSHLAKLTEVERTEFSLPRDMPHFCLGCFSCFVNGESTCPHAALVQPIAEAILNADVVVLTSPVYAMDVSGAMKALLDHLCYLWMSHRPDPRMFRKVGVTVTTTAGAGLRHTVKTLKNSLSFWGVKKIYSFRKPASAMSWSEVSPKRKAEIERETAKLARRIAAAAVRPERLRGPLFRAVFFRMMVGMMKKNTWNPRDKAHWETLGWLTGKRPF